MSKEDLVLKIGLASFFISVAFLSYNVFSTIYFSSGKSSKASTPFTFKKVINLSASDELNFIPKKVGNLTVDRDKLIKDAKQVYGLEKEEDIAKALTPKIIGLVYMSNVLDKPLPETLTSVDELNRLYKEYKDEYDKDVIKLTGFFLKSRFVGVYKENLSKLEKNYQVSSAEAVKDLARRKLEEYISKYKSVTALNMDEVVKEFNSDEVLSLLNNNEASSTFEDFNMYPPIFDDPDFYKYIEELPEKGFSKIYVLKTKNPLQDGYQEYAYVVFYVKEKSGTRFPLEGVIRSYAKKINIQK